MPYMKKLLFIDPQSYSNLALYDYNLLKGMALNIKYCCNTLYNAPVINRVDYHKVFIYSTKHNFFGKTLSYLLSDIKVLIIALKFKPDVIHIQWWKIWIVDYIFLIFLKLITKNIIFTAHNLEPHDSNGKYKKRCIRYYNIVSKIIVHSKSTKDELVTNYKISADKIFVIPHGLLSVSVDEKQVKKLMKVFIHRYNLTNKIVFSSLGTQSFYKGTDIIFESFVRSNLLRNNPAVALFFLGRGDIVNEQSTNKYSNIYSINKHISDEEFIAFLRLSNVTLLPYRQISQSGVLFTAIDNEIPFIVSNAGGLAEPLSLGDVGWCIGEASIDKLSLRLEYLLSHSEEILSRKENSSAWNSVKKYYDWEIITQLTIQCYFKDEL